MTDKALVLFTIGTDHHQFDRLIGWSEVWAEANRGYADVFVQHGSSRSPTGVLSAQSRLPRAELDELMRRAAAVVTHGGGGSITQCWQAGTIPIVVPRLGRLGEHVDEHQEAFASRLAAMNYAYVARTYDELDDLLRARTRSPAADVPRVDISRPTRTIETIGRKVEDLVVSARGRRRFARSCHRDIKSNAL